MDSSVDPVDVQGAASTEPDDSLDSSSTSSTTSFTDAYKRWDGCDIVQGKILWTTLHDALEKAVVLVETLMIEARQNPTKVIALFAINHGTLHSLFSQTTTAASSSPSDNCVALIGLQLFEWTQGVFMDVRSSTMNEGPWKLKANPKNKARVVFEKLVFISNFVLKVIPNRFPWLIMAVRCHAGEYIGLSGTGGSNDSGLEMVRDLFGKLPFKDHVAMLRAFSFGKKGCCYDKNLDTTNENVGMNRTLDVLDILEVHYHDCLSRKEDLDAAWEDTGSITKIQASKICHQAFGVEPLFWEVCNNKKRKHHCVQVSQGGFAEGC
jgi:hypothetical protein